MKRMEMLLNYLSIQITQDSVNELLYLLGNTRLSAGSSRTVYDLKNGYVAKIPQTSDYRDRISPRKFKDNSKCNIVEYLLYRHSTELPLLPCELYFFKEIPIIVMEKVDERYETTRNFERPFGAGRFCDSFQGGVTRDGRYLSYDYGYEDKLLAAAFPDFDISEYEYEIFASSSPNFVELICHQTTELVFTP